MQCPCNDFIKRHFNQYFVNENNNNNKHYSTVNKGIVFFTQAVGQQASGTKVYLSQSQPTTSIGKPNTPGVCT